MDLFSQLGALALASRMRRLADRMSQDVVVIYKEQNIDFEPRWFTVYYLLVQKAPLSIVEVAQILGISHPCVNQIANDMIKAGLVKAQKDKTDKRKRLLVLTDKGRDLLPALQTIWDDVENALKDVIADSGLDVMGMLETMEGCLDKKEIYERFYTFRAQRERDAVRIIDFEPRYRDAFRDLNLEWISQYFVVEPEDERMLMNPEGEILDKGGAILFAVSHNPMTGQDEVLGTCALIKKPGKMYELAKMGVTESARGKHIGKKLLAGAIDKARQLGAGMLMLETNSRLTPAINLYRKLGFEPVPFEEASKYDRADVCMRLAL